MQKSIGGCYPWFHINFYVLREIWLTNAIFNVRRSDAKIQPKARQEVLLTESASHHLKKEISCKKCPEGPLALQRQLRKFCILVIIFRILVKFRAKFCKMLHSEILSFSDVFTMIFYHFWLIWIKFKPLGLIECQFWNFHFQAAFHNFQTGPKFSIQKSDSEFKLRL